MKTLGQNSTELCSALKGFPHAKKTSTTGRERAYWASPAASRFPSFVHTTVPRLPSRVGANNPPQPSIALRSRGTGPSTQRQPHPMAAVPSCPGGNTSQTSKNRRGLRKYATLPPCLSQHNGRRRRGPKPAPGITRKRFRKSPQRHPKIDPEPPPKTAPDTTQIGRFLRVPKRDKNARKKQKNIAQQWRPPSTKIARDNRLPQGPDRPKHDPDLTNNAAPSLCPRHTAPWTLATLQAHMSLPRTPEDHVDLHTERRARA